MTTTDPEHLEPDSAVDPTSGDARVVLAVGLIAATLASWFIATPGNSWAFIAQDHAFFEITWENYVTAILLTTSALAAIGVWLGSVAWLWARSGDREAGGVAVLGLLLALGALAVTISVNT